MKRLGIFALGAFLLYLAFLMSTSQQFHPAVMELRQNGQEDYVLAGFTFGGIGFIVWAAMMRPKTPARKQAGDAMDAPLMTFRERSLDRAGRIRGNADNGRGGQWENHGQRPDHRDGAAASGG